MRTPGLPALGWTCSNHSRFCRLRVCVSLYLSSRLKVQDRGSTNLSLGHVSKGGQATLVDSGPKTVPNGEEVTASTEIRVLWPEEEESLLGGLSAPHVFWTWRTGRPGFEAGFCHATRASHLVSEPAEWGGEPCWEGGGKHDLTVL